MARTKVSLQYVFTLVKNQNQQDDPYADLRLQHTGTSTVPIDIAITTPKPDLVIVNSKDKYVTLFELSVPFESNIESTYVLKVNQYRQLIADIEEKGFKVDYYPVEIGTRGFISKNNDSRLKSFFKKKINNVSNKCSARLL